MNEVIRNLYRVCFGQYHLTGDLCILVDLWNLHINGTTLGQEYQTACLNYLVNKLETK